MKGKNKMLQKIMAAVTALLLWILPGGLPSAPAETPAGEEMTLTAFNVGKADCLLLCCGENAYLIDTARGKHHEQIMEGLKKLGVDHLDGILITHMDSDHVGGLKKLLKTELQADHLYGPAYYFPEEGKKEESPILKAAEKQNMTPEVLQPGDELPLGSGTLRVLGPLRAATDKEDNNSLVLYAEAAGGSILLAGDMEFPEEEDLLAAGSIPEADVLKVGNHGDGDATSPELLRAVKPRIAVISTSTEEKSSTPADRVLQDLAACGAEVYQTQEAVWGIRVTVRDGKVTAARMDTLP